MASRRLLDLEHRLLGVPHHPEGDGIDVDRHRVFGEGRLGLEIGDPDPLVDVVGDLVDDREDSEEAGAPEAAELPEAQNHRLFPLVSHLDARAHETGKDHCGHQDRCLRPMPQVGEQRGAGGKDQHGLPYLEEPERHREAHRDADHCDHRFETERVHRQVHRQAQQTQRDKHHDVEGCEPEIRPERCRKPLERIHLHLTQLVHCELLFSALTALLEVFKNVVEGEAVGRCPRQELLTEVVEDSPPLDVIPFHRTTTDKGAGAHLGFYQAGELELGVGPADRVGVDGEVDRELPDRGEALAWRDRFGGDRGLHLIDDLAVEGHAALDVELDFECHALLQCSSVLVFWFINVIVY
jgi:hypothetical protein